MIHGEFPRFLCILSIDCATTCSFIQLTSWIKIRYRTKIESFYRNEFDPRTSFSSQISPWKTRSLQPFAISTLSPSSNQLLVRQNIIYRHLTRSLPTRCNVLDCTEGWRRILISSSVNEYWNINSTITLLKKQFHRRTFRRRKYDNNNSRPND